MKTANDIDRILDQVLDGLLDGTMKTEIAKEVSNAAGKRLKNVQMRLTYAELRKEQPNIAFLNEPVPE